MSNFHRNYERKLYLYDVLKVYVVVFFLKKEGKTFSKADEKNFASNLFLSGAGDRYVDEYIPSLISWVTFLEDQVCFSVHHGACFISILITFYSSFSTAF